MDPTRRPRAAFLSPLPVVPRRPRINPTDYPLAKRLLRLNVTPCACASSPNPAKQYVPLHVHSDFSLLDGASQLPTLVDRAAELGVPALALTDHGVLYGAIQLVRRCKGTRVKPIIGNEMYIVNDVPGDPSDPTAPAPKRYHLIVLAKNTHGYRNLVKLTTIAHLEGKVGKGIFARPCINKAQLFQHRDGLIVSSACLGGEIPQAILNDDIDMARTVAMWFRDVFGDDFYLEIQDHGSAEDKKVNPVMIQLSQELGIKVIATNDSHFTSCLDAEAHDALICIQTGKLLEDENRLHYAGNEFFKSVEEMRECFVDHLPLEAVDQALCNTIDVARKVDIYELFGATRIPDFPVPKQFHGPKDEYLRHVAHESLRGRLDTRIRAGLVERTAEEHYFEVLGHELDMICQMGFSSYFLVVWDYIRHAKELHIPVGPGRGSAAGSLVAFALRITDVDPVPFNLLFERFLNPERKSMPDIDTDFSVEGRDRIIKYVSERYGADRVAQIITFNRLTSKAVLKDVARVHSVPYSEADRLAKLIPVVRGKPATLTALLSDNTPSPDFKKVIEANPPYRTWLEKAQRIEGANKTYGIHAAGVVISASPLTDIVPLSRAKHGETITQYAMEDVEALGLLKMDFLGLKNLTVIETALRFINQGRKHLGIDNELEFSVDTLPLDDEKTYKLLAEGELDGIFQLDASGGMRNIVRELRPSSLEDISSILALYRPGPLDAGLIPKFIRRKHGVDPIEYDHPLLEPILKETYGIMVYQEQIMRIARDLAGYSLGQADILRRAMGKKKTKDMEREKPRFVEGAKKRGLSEEKAVELFDMMIKFAEYCFNKSHSTAYAYLTYQTAYLKANYPVEYSAALLCANMNQSDKLARYLADANLLGVRVLPPSVNKSDLGFTVDRSGSNEGVVLFGLEAVKTVGASVSEALIAERAARGPFRNIMEFLERVNLRVLNKRAVAALIQAGAFDELHLNRRVLLNSFEGMLALRRKLRDRRKRQESKGLSDEENAALDESERLAWEEAEIQLARNSENEPDFTSLERLAGEKASIGFYASGHPLYELQDVAKVLGCTKVDTVIGIVGDDNNGTSSDDAAFAGTIADGNGVMILSCITDLKKMTTARGKKMAKWTIEDAANRVPGIVFPNTYDVVEQELRDPAGITEGVRESTGMDARDEVIQSEPAFVVKEDARVVVWGKVDRESSGTSQIVIDDVQRVEDVQAVVATASYNPARPASLHLQILQSVAASVLDVDLAAPKHGVYRDANGEIKKRRWTKSKPLAERNRLPLVLHCLDEDGNCGTALYAGNALRLPSDCRQLLRTMKRQTGFDFKMISVAEDIMEGNLFHQVRVAKASTECKEGTDGKVAVQFADTRELCEEVQSKEEAADDTLANEEQVSIALERAGVSSESTLEVDEDVCEEKAFPNKPETLLGDDQSVEVSQSRGSEFSLVNVEGVLLTEDEHAEYEVEYRRFTTRKVDRKRTRVEAALHAVRNPPFHKDSFFNDTFRKPPSLQTLSIHDDFRAWEDNTVSVAARPFSEVASTGLSSPPKSEILLKPQNESSSTAVQGGIGDMEQIPAVNMQSATVDYVEVLSRAGSSSSKGSYSATGGLDKPIKSNSDERDSPSEDDGGEDILRQNDIDNVGDISMAVEDSTIKVGKEFVSTGGDAAPTAVFDCHAGTSHPSGEESEATTTDLSDGLVVDFDSVRAAGVFDAICLVAGDVAGKYTKCKSTICTMTEVNLGKLVETSVSLRISANVVVTESYFLYVVVDIRESKPTGKRKRVRSFGPVVVAFRTDAKLEAVSPRTKKARQLVDTVVERLTKAAACETSAGNLLRDSKSKPDSRNGKTSISSSKTGFVFAERWDSICKGYPRIGDGGQVLRYMSRAAEYCVSRAIGTVPGLRILKLVSFICDDSALLMDPAKSLRIRAHIDGKSFEGIRVQVQGNVSLHDQRSANLLATFMISDDGFKQLKSIRVIVDEEPLFEGTIVEEVFLSCVKRINAIHDG